MLTPQQAWTSVLAHTAVLPVVQLPAPQALGHVLAEPIVADRDLPPADRAAMDGFAVRAADLTGLPVTLPVVGEIAAGSPAAPQVREGTCARIFTGANLPPGADTVVMVETTREACPGQITFQVAAEPGANIFRRGENAKQGDTLVPAGSVLGPMHLGMAASAGHTTLRVIRRPRVAIVATGRELLAPEDAAGPHQERDSNGPTLSAATTAGGFDVVLLRRVPDKLPAVTSAISEALASADVVVTSGGVSVGAYDFVPAAVEAAGATTIFHGVAMKPGKPLLFATGPEPRLFFGLPGNPLSAATGFFEFVLPTLRRMAGYAESRCRPLLRARLVEPLSNKPGRQRFVLATLSFTDSGPEVTAIPSQSVADLVAGADADGAIIVPAEARALAAGSLVDFRPWRERA